MSKIRIELCVLGGNRGLAADASGGILDRIVAAADHTATTTETIEANLIPSLGATHAILIGITGNTLVSWGAAPNAAARGKLIREGTEIAIALNTGDKISLKEYV